LRFTAPTASIGARPWVAWLPMPTREMQDAETERLWLRRWRREHTAGLAAVNADAEVMNFLNGGVPLTPTQSSIVSDRVLDHWKTYGFGLWAVVAKATGQMLGFAGICHPLWFPDWSAGVEVGWRLRRDAWGQGYATEAGREALRVGFSQQGLHEIVAFVHEGNHRSAAVAERLEMTRCDRVHHPDRPHRLDIFTATAA
jgi:RimJ/RimL family protein N-acetyltransferase